jgi:hypothetical protein
MQRLTKEQAAQTDAEVIAFERYRDLLIARLEMVDAQRKFAAVNAANLKLAVDAEVNGTWTTKL